LLEVTMRSSFLLHSVVPCLAVMSLGAWALGCGADETLSPVGGGVFPESDVELVRDELGITHVFAKSDGDAFFGQGYAMARDRLFAMELNRRQARGTQAELLGEGSVRSDVASRTMGFARLGAADAAMLKTERPEDLGLVEAWVAGVNQRIAEVERGEAPRPYGLGAGELDFVPEKWTPEDAFAIGKTLAFGLSNTLDFDVLATAILRLAPDTAADIPLGLAAFDTAILDDGKAAPPPPPQSPGPSIDGLGPAKSFNEKFSYKPLYAPLGSNNWVVDAAHTDNGRPLLAGDPHQGLTSPSRLWPTHVNSADAGGTVDAIGFAFVGTPGVQLGHNAHVGWTATTNYADVMDLWDVEVDGFETVSLGGETHAIVTRTETIAVKDGGEVSVEIHEVPGFGVILPDQILPVPRPLLADGQVLFNWIGFGATREASAYFAIDRATSVDDFDSAVDLLDVGAVNFLAADARDVTYRVHTHVPDRGEPSSRPMPWHIVSGDDPENFWTRGFLPDSALPKLRSPASGFISSANNDPFGFMADGTSENDAFYYGGNFATGFRAYRIRELLETKLANGKVTHADMEEMQRDTRQPMVDTVVPRLAAAIAAIGDDPKLVDFEGRADLAALSDRLEGWDGRFDRDSGEAVIFFGLQWFAARRVFEGPFTKPLFEGIANASEPYFIGQLRNVLEGRFPKAASFLPEGEALLLLRALDDTSQWLQARFAGIDAAYAWRDVHAAELGTHFGGALVVPSLSRDGGIDTVNVSDCAFFDEAGGAHETFVARSGSVYRMVVSFGEDGRPAATINFSQGASGEPGEPHFGDQDALWVEAGHTALPFTRTEIEARAEDRVTLSGK